MTVQQTSWTARVFSFPNPVNDYAARLVAGMVVLMGLAVLLGDAVWLLPFLGGRVSGAGAGRPAAKCCRPAGYAGADPGAGQSLSAGCGSAQALCAVCWLVVFRGRAGLALGAAAGRRFKVSDCGARAVCRLGDRAGLLCGLLCVWILYSLGLGAGHSMCRVRRLFPPWAVKLRCAGTNAAAVGGIMDRALPDLRAACP